MFHLKPPSFDRNTWWNIFTVLKMCILKYFIGNLCSEKMNADMDDFEYLSYMYSYCNENCMIQIFLSTGELNNSVSSVAYTCVT